MARIPAPGPRALGPAAAQWQPGAIRRLLEKLPGGDGAPLAEHVARIHDAGRPRGFVDANGTWHPDQTVDEVRKELEKAKAAANAFPDLGATARLYLAMALQDRGVHAARQALAALAFVLPHIDPAADRAIGLVETIYNRSGPHGAEGVDPLDGDDTTTSAEKRVALAAAHAYNRLVGSPPTTHPRQRRREEHPFHTLVRELFELGEFAGSWQGCARWAAERV